MQPARPTAPRPSHILDMAPARVAGQHRIASNDLPEHRITRERGGNGFLHSYTPMCSCGWRGREVSEACDTMSLDLREQEAAHRREVE